MFVSSTNYTDGILSDCVLRSVVKSRLQAGTEHAKRYTSAFHGLLTIVKEEGVEGLYKGIASKLIQSVLTAAILFASQKRIYDMTKKVCYSSTDHYRTDVSVIII